MRTPFALFFVTFLTTSVLAEPQPRDNQTVAVGPWAIATIYKADKLESCTMSRPAGELGITFVRTRTGWRHSSTHENGGSIEAKLILFASLPVRVPWMQRPWLKRKV